jgi:hypothetical protein
LASWPKASKPILWRRFTQLVARSEGALAAAAGAASDGVLEEPEQNHAFRQARRKRSAARDPERPKAFERRIRIYCKAWRVESKDPADPAPLRYGVLARVAKLRPETDPARETFAIDPESGLPPRRDGRSRDSHPIPQPDASNAGRRPSEARGGRLERASLSYAPLVSWSARCDRAAPCQQGRRLPRNP